MILNVTTGLGCGFYHKDHLLPLEENSGSHIWVAELRVEPVLRLKPEIATLGLGTGVMGALISIEAMLTPMAILLRDAGIKLESELFGTGGRACQAPNRERGAQRSGDGFLRDGP